MLNSNVEIHKLLTDMQFKIAEMAAYIEINSTDDTVAKYAEMTAAIKIEDFKAYSKLYEQPAYEAASKVESMKMQYESYCRTMVLGKYIRPARVLKHIATVSPAGFSMDYAIDAKHYD